MFRYIMVINILLMVFPPPGCTLTASFYAEKRWYTDRDVFQSPDLNTRVEWKASTSGKPR